MSDLEIMLAFQIRAHKLPEPATEHRFAAEHVGRDKWLRKRLTAAGLKDWRFDFAWPERMFAVEVEGITPGGGGRHQRPKGFEDDILKYHHAMLLGWTVYRTTGRLIRSGQSILIISKLLAVN